MPVFVSSVVRDSKEERHKTKEWPEKASEERATS